MLISESIQEALVNEFWQDETGRADGSGLFGEFAWNDALTENRRDTIRLMLEKERCERIKELCNGSDVLIFNFYSTAFTILLSKYFGATDIAFISPLSQFDDTAAADDLFLFRSVVGEQQSFKEIFSANKSFLARALENCVSIDQMRKNVAADVMEQLNAFSLVVGNGKVIYEGCQPELLFAVTEEADNYFFEIEFSSSRFNKGLLELLGHNFDKLLGEILQKIYEPVSELSIQSDTEQKLLKEFNAVEPYFSLEENVVELIVKQAALQGGKIALRFNEQQISYTHLDEVSNRIARYLLAHCGLKPDMLLGVMMDRSITMAACILAIWKAGAAYVPIDKKFPDDRIRQIVDLSQLAAIVVDDTVPQEQTGRLQLPVPVINLDAVEKEVIVLSPDPVEIKIRPDHLAYVIYTSGSTGEPKGVMIEHLGMINHIGAKITEMGIEGESKVAQNAPHTFDISVWQMFAALVAGGTTVIYDNELVMDPAAFTEQVSADGISVLELVPSYLVEMLSILEHRRLDLSALKILILNAETLMPVMVKRWLTLYPDIPIVNTYGATEASDDTSHYIMYDCPAAATVPVMKRPIQHVEVHIVDDKMRAVPIGIKGEILLAGPGIGRGYLNDKEKTARSFLKGPLNDINCPRIYRTGDLGRYLPDGTMEFLGRKDAQVKIRGNRIELGEIEHTLMKIDGIEHAAVLANIEKQYLVAYYQSTQELSADYLQDDIAQKLPEYMVPQYFMWFEKLPVNANGKIDRKNLPSPESSQLSSSYVAPRDESEEMLASIWQDVLGREKVGVKDDFFELGGHSLKVMRLIGQIHKTFNVKIALRELFRFTILEEQAQLVKQAQKKAFVAIPAAPVQQHYPLSPSQQRMWVLSQLEEGSIAYNMAGVFVFEGELDHNALQYAFSALVERHESLRTSFSEAAGEIRQFIHAPAQITAAINYSDLRDEEHPEQKASMLLQQDFATPFDLTAAPLVRVGLYQVATDKYIFMYVMHHIISDGWSMDILMRELGLLYSNHQKLDPHVLAPLRIQYKDYAAWLQEQLNSDAFAQHKNYWLQKFEGELPVLELPGDHPRPAVKTFNGRQLARQLDAKLVNGIRTIGHKQGATLFMNLLAVVNTLLYRYTGQEDIIIGSPVAGREHADLASQIGLYVNTLALRTQLKGTDDYVQLLQRIKEITIGAYEHQEYPFDELIDQLNLPRDVSRNPLFEVMVVLQNTAQQSEAKQGRLGNVAVSGFDTGENTISKFDLLFDFAEMGDELRMLIQYNSDIYSDASMHRMADHFEQLMAAIISHPSVPLAELNYLSESEKQQLLTAFNDTAAPYPADKTLVDLFAQQVERSPDAIALVFDGCSFTYRELNEQSNQLAAYLRERYDLKPDEPAAIQLYRSEWMIISILGVLKAGGAYMPVDPDYPQERITYMLEDSRCKVLIDEKELQQFRAEQDRYSKENIKPVNKPTDLVYVIYTSGSTGRPKGCMLEHRGIVNRLEWMWQHYAFTSSDIILQKTTFTFDVSVWELFLPLCWGARMVLCQKEDIASPERILNLIEEQHVTCLHFVPGMLNAFIGELFEEEAFIQKLKTLRLIVTSGEALPLETVKSWYRKLDVPIHNLYGPTEASVDVTYYAVQRDDERVLIGEPLWNTQIYILSESNQVQPIGIAGEICLAGDGLARGYLNKPELTAEKFVSNPFRQGERMYRTGDLGRWTADGKIEYIGRKDNQVKIRGYRIELGEIENALLSHEAVSAAVVMVRADKSGEKELVAYVSDASSDTPSDASADALRTHLRNILPAYMIPAHFIQLNEFPLTASGKIDRKKLLHTQGIDLTSTTTYIPPSNETEEKLVSIWQEVLGKDKIGVRDNFFDTGGNSLRLIKMIRQVNKQFNRNISVVSAFKFPTIDLLSEYLHSNKETAIESEEEMLADVKIMEGTFGSLNYVGDEN